MKEDFKKLTGKDWKPNMKSAAPSVTVTPPSPAADGAGDNLQKEVLMAKITKQGDIVRDLKTKKASKQEIDEAVKGLLELKAEYKALTGMYIG